MVGVVGSSPIAPTKNQRLSAKLGLKYVKSTKADGRRARRTIPRVRASNIVHFPVERVRRNRERVDPIVARMKARGLPLTRKVYLELAYPDGAPDPLPGELEAAIPDELRVDRR